MTADDIRAQYLECLARAAYDRRRAITAPRWEDHDLGMEGIREFHRNGIAYLLDALAADGRLPDGIEISPDQSLWRWKHEWQEVE